MSENLPKRYVLSSKYFLFLAAYTRQINLSIDRCRWTSWSDLVAYYQGQVAPSIVLDLIDRLRNDSIRIESWAFYKANRSSKMKMLIDSIILGRYYLRSIEITRIAFDLEHFDLLLRDSSMEYTMEIESLRLNFSRHYAEIFKRRMKSEEVDRCMYIECYMGALMNPSRMRDFISDIDI